MYSRVPPSYGSRSRWRGVRHHKGRSQRHKGSSYSPMNRTTKVWFTFHYRNPSRRNPEPLHNNPRHNPQLDCGLPSGYNRPQRSQPPQRCLGSKDPRVTSSQTLTSTNPRGEHKPMHNAMARAHKVLKFFTLKFQHSNKC